MPYEGVEALQKMKQAVLERPRDRFNMQLFISHYPCGSICCVIGSYVEKYGAETGLKFGPLGGVWAIDPEYKSSSISNEISSITKISVEDIRKLIFPSYYDYYDHQNLSDKEPVLKRLDELIKKYSGET